MSKSYSIVGAGHTIGGEAALARLKAGTPVLLVREPTNKFDPNAIMVWVDGQHVGYLPKKQNAALATFIDLNAKTLFQMATDEIGGMKVAKSIPAKFVRSPNSGFPQVEVSE